MITIYEIEEIYTKILKFKFKVNTIILNYWFYNKDTKRVTLDSALRIYKNTNEL